MKKFGTPIGAAPGSANEKVGFEGVGTPAWLGCVRAGAGLALGVGFGLALGLGFGLDDDGLLGGLEVEP